MSVGDPVAMVKRPSGGFGRQVATIASQLELCSGVIVPFMAGSRRPAPCAPVTTQPQVAGQMPGLAAEASQLCVQPRMNSRASASWPELISGMASVSAPIRIGWWRR